MPPSTTASAVEPLNSATRQSFQLLRLQSAASAAAHRLSVPSYLVPCSGSDASSRSTTGRFSRCVATLDSLARGLRLTGAVCRSRRLSAALLVQPANATVGTGGETEQAASLLSEIFTAPLSKRASSHPQGDFLGCEVVHRLAGHRSLGPTTALGGSGSWLTMRVGVEGPCPHGRTCCWLAYNDSVREKQRERAGDGREKQGPGESFWLPVRGSFSRAKARRQPSDLQEVNEVPGGQGGRGPTDTTSRRRCQGLYES